MIDFLKGKIEYLDGDAIIIDVMGVGYRIQCVNPYVFSAEEVTLIYTHYHVREDAHLLFGFSTKEEQQLFRRLIEVSGIGPKVALGMLSGGSPDALISAIVDENLTYLTKLPGIGKKTAQRIVLDLKDKLKDLAGLPSKTTSHRTEVSVDHILVDGRQSIWNEVKEALISLGYSEKETDHAWQELKLQVSDSDTVDGVLKKALKVLFQ